MPLPTQFQQFIHISRYARWLETENRRETWEETGSRYFDFMDDFLLENHSYTLPDNLRKRLENSILNLEVMPSMRALMTAGPALERESLAGFNCSFIAVDNVRAFDEALYVLMCGTGVGFSVEQAHISKLPTIAEDFFETDTTIVVRDSKAGWAKAFKEYIALLYSGQIPQVDASRVRAAGEPLKVFGGRASGKVPLIDLLNFTKVIFKNAAGRKLTPLECHDILCKTGAAVVVGGVRRSALISLSDLPDAQIRHAKDGDWFTVEPQRSLANNSAVYNGRPDVSTFFKEWSALYNSKSGERGIFNRKAAYNKMAENGRRSTTDSKDELLKIGTNPCVSKDTMIETDNGLEPVEDLIGKPFLAALNGGYYECTEGFFSTGENLLYEVSTSRGYSLKATAKHEIMTDSGWVKLEDLTIGDSLHLNDNVGPGILYTGITQQENEGWLVGSVLGDGGHNPEKYESYVEFWDSNREEKVERALKTLHSLGKKYQPRVLSPHKKTEKVSSTALTELCNKYLTAGDKNIKSVLYVQPVDFMKGFLQGYFDCDGSVQGNNVKGNSVRLTSVNYENLKIVQQMLLVFGIASTLCARKEAGFKEMPDGKGGLKVYPCKKLYEVIISRDSMDKYLSFVSFFDSNKNEKLQSIFTDRKRASYKDRFFTKVETITSLNKEETFDCTVESAHAFSANGIIVHNCGEILLRPSGLCNLTEVVSRADDTLETLKKKVEVAAILGTFQSCLTNFKYVRKIWKDNAEEERLLGVSITGIMDNALLNSLGNEELLEELKEHVIKTNKKWAAILGVNQSVATTCVKPSGTAGLLVDASPGIHTRHSPYYIRRVRGDKKDPLTALMIDEGIPHEDDVFNPNDTMVFSFPMKSPDGALTRDSLTAIESLEIHRNIRNHWCEHNPSMTVSVREQEWPGVGAWVWDNFDEISGVSFLPYSEHTYQQAPYEEITKQEYMDMLKTMPKDVDWGRLPEFEKEDTTTGTQELACSAGVCEIV